MAETQQKRWIVLINKSPRGPFTKNEIEYLLVEGVVRRNDVAFEVSEDGKEVLSGWKLLWQYNEFDRRQEETETSPERVLDRRQKSEPQPKATLPEDISHIAPEDLLIKLNKPALRPQHHIPDSSDLDSMTVSPSVNRWGWLKWGSPVALVMVVFLYIVAQPEGQRSPQTTQNAPPIQVPRALPRRSSPSAEHSPLSHLKPAPLKRERAVEPIEREVEEHSEDRDSGYLPPSEASEEEEDLPKKTKPKKRSKKKAKPESTEDYTEEDLEPETELLETEEVEVQEDTSVEEPEQPEEPPAEDF